ncbi:hypothetical protein AAMO2058_001032500 [Amorphochlora amoebiformis]
MECIRRSIVHRRSIRTALFLLAGLAATLASRPGATLLPRREGWGKAFRASRRDQADHTLSGWLGQGLYNIAADDLSADVGNFDPQPSSYASYARTPTFHLDEALPPAPLPYPHPRFPSQSIVAVDAREYQLLMRLEARVRSVVEELPVGKTPPQTRRRHELFARFDSRGAGTLSPTDAETGVRNVLGVDTTLLDCSAVLSQVFEAARTLRTQKRREQGLAAESSNTGMGSDVLFRQEFRILLLYLREFFQVYLLFSEADVNKDKMLDYTEFHALASSGKLNIINDIRADFTSLSGRSRGVAWPNFCDWALKIRAEAAANAPPTQIQAQPKSQGFVRNPGISQSSYPPAQGNSGTWNNAGIYGQGQGNTGIYGQGQANPAMYVQGQGSVGTYGQGQGNPGIGSFEATPIAAYSYEAGLVQNAVEIRERYYALVAKFKRLRLAYETCRSEKHAQKDKLASAESRLTSEIRSREVAESACREAEIKADSIPGLKKALLDLQEYSSQLQVELNRRTQEEQRASAALATHQQDYRSAVLRVERVEGELSILQREASARQREILTLAHSHHAASVRAEELEKALSTSQVRCHEAEASLRSAQAKAAAAGEREAQAKKAADAASRALQATQKQNAELVTRVSVAETRAKRALLTVNTTRETSEDTKRELDNLGARHRKLLATLSILEGSLRAAQTRKGSVDVTAHP